MISLGNEVTFCDSLGIKVYMFELVLDKKEFIHLQFYVDVTKKDSFIGSIALRLIAFLLYVGWYGYL